MNLVDVEIEKIGLIRGRDAIQIVQIESKNPRNIKVSGQVDASLCSNNENLEEFFKIEFLFEGVILFNILEDEIRGLNLSDEEFDMYANSNSESAVEEIQNSRVAKENIGVHRDKLLKHWIITAYDYNIEVVCEKFSSSISTKSRF